MIGTIDVKVQAHNPNFPLEPVFTFINSAQSFRIRNVPRAVGKWNITKVFIHLNYPDNTTISKGCVLNGNIWIGTVEGCATSGTSTNGFYVTASGIDENENIITNYVLGAGDLYVKDLDGTIDPERVGTKMYFNDTLPTNPKKGDATFIDGVLNVYDGTDWTPVANDPDLSNYYTKTEVDEAIGEVEDSIPTKTSDLTNDSGFITSANVPTKTSDLTNDSGFITATALTPYREKSDLYYEHSFHKANWQNVPRFIMDYDGTQTIFDKFDSTLNRWTVSTGTSDWFVEMTFVGMEADPQFTLMRLDTGIESIQPTEGAGTTTVTFVHMGIEGTFTMDMSDQLVCKVYVDRYLSALEARMTGEVSAKRDFSDMTVKGVPQNTNYQSWFTIKYGTTTENAWYYDEGRWESGNTLRVLAAPATIYTLQKLQDGQWTNIGEFTLDNNAEATITYEGVTYSITGYVGEIVTSNQLTSQIAALEARISALENNNQ